MTLLIKSNSTSLSSKQRAKKTLRCLKESTKTTFTFIELIFLKGGTSDTSNAQEIIQEDIIGG